MNYEELDQEVNVLIASCNDQQIASQKDVEVCEKDLHAIAGIHKAIRKYCDKLDEATKILLDKINAFEQKKEESGPEPSLDVDDDSLLDFDEDPTEEEELAMEIDKTEGSLF